MATDGYFLMGWNGTVALSKTRLAPGQYEFQVDAYGTPAKGVNPEMVLEVVMLETGGERRSIARQAFSVNQQAEMNVLPFVLERDAEVILTVSFTNDYGAATGDRNLFLQRVWIDEQLTPRRVNK